MTQQQADAIADVLHREYETNPVFRGVIDAKVSASQESAKGSLHSPSLAARAELLSVSGHTLGQDAPDHLPFPLGCPGRKGGAL